MKPYIASIHVENFVTFEALELEPIKGLNIILGPNGSGKSSVVCAICLGLGWSPKCLGRERDIVDFIKRGKSMGNITLAVVVPDQVEQLVIIRTIRRKSPHSTFSVNGKSCSEKLVRNLSRSLKFDVDNPCDFLPQEKIVEFSSLPPELILEQTERSVEPILLDYQKKISELTSRLAAFQGHLGEKRTVLRELEHKMERLVTLEQSYENGKWEKLRLLTAMDCICIKFGNSTILRTQRLVNELSNLRTDCLKLSLPIGRIRYTAIERLNLLRDNQVCRSSYQTAYLLHKGIMAFAVAGANQYQGSLFSSYSQKLKLEIQQHKAFFSEVRKYVPVLLRSLTCADATDIDCPSTPAFNLRAIRKSIREVQDELFELNSTLKGVEAGTSNLQTNERQKVLGKLSPDTARLLKVLCTDRLVPGKIHNPPALECDVTDRSLAACLESLIPFGVLLTFTLSSFSDLLLLQQELFEKRFRNCPVTHINLRFFEGSNKIENNLQAQELGFEGWAIDFITGPKEVLNMICRETGLEKAGICKVPPSDQTVHSLRSSGLRKWATRETIFSTASRYEYGNAATSLRLVPVREARFFRFPLKGQRCDHSVIHKNELSANIVERKKALNSLQKNLEFALLANTKQKIPVSSDSDEKQPQDSKKIFMHLRKSQYLLRTTRESRNEFLSAALVSIRTDLIENDELSVSSSLSLAATICLFVNTLEHLCIVTVLFAPLQKQVGSARTYYGLRMQLEKAITMSVEKLQSIFGTNLKLWACLVQRQNHRGGLWASLLSRLYLGRLVRMLKSAHAKECCNPVETVNTRIERQNLGKEISLMKSKTMRDETSLINQENAVKLLRNIWETRIALHVSAISKTFTVLLRDLQCDGEICIKQKCPEISWALQVKVGFRADGQLHVLDPQRQSGGERAITTVCYFLALHKTTGSAIRLVDEINQGMDEYNERWTHSKIIQVTSQSYSLTQYFLISPKLLQDLAYNESTECHIIFTGDWVKTG